VPTEIAYNCPVAQPARHLRSVDEGTPSLDPAAIERAYLRERARRRARLQRHNESRSSNARFWVVLAVLLALTVFLGLTAWHDVQTTFGV
jgi:predicted anti-sigma-YlaC factor YlaD